MGVDNGSIITGRAREHHITSSSDIGAARLLFRTCGKSIKLSLYQRLEFSMCRMGHQYIMVAKIERMAS
ncbi:hypothetical protein HZ326_2868 [Fusarium oxysporum f. sp. albedinis]|nr:hypothetical protein HZ326_2868 [Fusarium oxysporum f. sp. albedinis]